MSADLEQRLGAMGVMNAGAYAGKFAEDEWTWEALVECGDEKLDALVKRVGMKEGSALTFTGKVREAREQARLEPAAPSNDAHQSVRVHGAAARETDGTVCFAEGCRWLYGFGEGVDYPEAASYLKRGAQLGHALSAAHLASILMEGRGVRGNPKAAQLEATMWAMRSCDAMGLHDEASRGDAGARLALGLLLQAGIGCEMNQALAVNHFRAAAMAGDADRKSVV